MADAAATYSGDPSRSTGDRVRYLCGDTALDRAFLLTDQEIAFEIVQTLDHDNADAERPYSAAVAALEHMIVRVAQRVNVVDGDAKKDLTDQITNMEKALERLIAQATKIEGASPYGSVPSLAGRVGTDTGPYFEVGMQENPDGPFSPKVWPPASPSVWPFVESVGGSAP